MRRNFMAAAAYVPFGNPGSEPLEAATKRAIDWIRGRERVEGRQAGLVVPRRGDYDALAGFDRGRIVATPRSRTPLGSGPVLVYEADMDFLYLGANAASSIAVVDWAQAWLPSWASVVGAVNLFRGEVSPHPEPEVAELFDQLDWAGNNGWFDMPGIRDARRLLGVIDRPVADVMGAMLAYGHSVASVQALAKLKS